jgi:hypothetical protein
MVPSPTLACPDGRGDSSRAPCNLGQGASDWGQEPEHVLMPAFSADRARLVSVVILVHWRA